jgi:hypothetical protein
MSAYSSPFEAGISTDLGDRGYLAFLLGTIEEEDLAARTNNSLTATSTPVPEPLSRR